MTWWWNKSTTETRTLHSDDNGRKGCCFIELSWSKKPATPVAAVSPHGHKPRTRPTAPTPNASANVVVAAGSSSRSGRVTPITATTTMVQTLRTTSRVAERVIDDDFDDGIWLDIPPALDVGIADSAAADKLVVLEGDGDSERVRARISDRENEAIGQRRISTLRFGTPSHFVGGRDRWCTCVAALPQKNRATHTPGCMQCPHGTLHDGLKASVMHPRSHAAAESSAPRSHPAPALRCLPAPSHPASPSSHLRSKPLAQIAPTLLAEQHGLGTPKPKQAIPKQATPKKAQRCS